jgi:hypothetical protein
MTPIDWVFDTRLRSDGYLGFEFDSEAERARLEPAFVRRLATALGANHAIVVTVGKHEKRRALLAAYWSGDPWESRWNGGLFLEPVEPEVERIRKLASYLQDGSARRTVAAEEEGFFQTRRPAGRDSKGTSGWTVAKWTLTGVAIPMLALGTYWTFIECRMCDGEYTSYEHLRWGRVLFTAGAVSAVLAIELWILGVPRQRDPKSVTVIPVVGKTERGTWIFGAGGRF